MFTVNPKCVENTDMSSRPPSVADLRYTTSAASDPNANANCHDFYLRLFLLNISEVTVS